jgi:hypothetical protein
MRKTSARKITVKPAAKAPEPRVRDLWEIAQEIRREWQRPYFGAVPYIDAMNSLRGVDQLYGVEPGVHIVRYFLANAGSWRGETARRIKDELRSMVDKKGARS